jgi:hypothetical protein
LKKEEKMNPSKAILAALTLGLLLVVLTIGFASAQEGEPPARALSPDAPQVKSDFIPVQGRMTNSSGLPINGTYTLTFRLYDENSGGTALCQDNAAYVEVENGLFLTYMNAYGCPIDGRQLYLGVEVEGDGEMVPRQYIDNVPYAWSLRPGAVISSSMGNNAILHIENWGSTGRGLRSYAMSQTGANYGMVGASRSPDGFGGYFYNTGGGVGLDASSQNGTGLKARSVNGTGLNASSTAGYGLFAESTDNFAVYATSVNAAGVHGFSGSSAGVEGTSLIGPGVYANSLNGPGIYAESLDGVAIAANGAITSTEPTYLWISGNDVRQAGHNDSTDIDLNSRGGARIYRGATIGSKDIILPITIAGTLYGQDVRLTALELYWKGDTSFDVISTIRLRRWTGVCQTCIAEILADTTVHVCDEADNDKGCTITKELTKDNVLDPGSGILYLTLQLTFESNVSWIDFDGARLTLEYDD